LSKGEARGPAKVGIILGGKQRGEEDPCRNTGLRRADGGTKATYWKADRLGDRYSGASCEPNLAPAVWVETEGSEEGGRRMVRGNRKGDHDLQISGWKTHEGEGRGGKEVTVPGRQKGKGDETGGGGRELLS